MSNSKTKWWLVAVAICCLAPAAFAGQGFNQESPNNRKKHHMPEGGSTAIYLLGAGLTCFGAMFLRSKLARPAQL
jgi:hypothetical protein